jgi:uncharacterized protein (TIRG00374 family)
MNWKKIARIGLGLSGVVIFAIILYLGGTEALSRVVHGDPLYLLATLLAIGGITLTASLRWRLIVSALTRQPVLPLRQIYYYNIVGRLISLVAPRGVGDFAGRPLALRAGGGSSLGMALYSTLLDRLFDYILMMLMTGPALLYVGHLVSLEVGALLAAALVGISFFVIATRFGQVVRWFTAFTGQIAAWGSRVPLLRRLIPQDKVNRMRQLEGIQLDFWTTGRVYLLTIVQILMMVLRSHLAARALGLHLPLLLLLLAAPVAQLGQLFAFTPGALGIRELSWLGVLQATGIPRADLLTFVVGHRIYVYICILVLAFVSHVVSILWPPRAPSTPPVIEADRLKTQDRERVISDYG